MPYRGEDLDLRTPQGWTPPGRDASGRDTAGRETAGREGAEPNWWTRSTIYKGGRADPIWVDDNVMACCNHAFDLAIAHRAPEVRLEHLINAMTMNDAIAQELEARGIGVAQLRRESGVVLASESPAGTASGKQPKRSEALEEALRLAADRAYPRRTPVTIDDILHVLFDMKRDLPGLQMLRRHSTPWVGRNGADQRNDLRPDLRPDLRLEPLPHLSRPAYPADTPRYPVPEEPRPRYASNAAHEYFTQAPSQPQPMQQPIAPIAAPVRGREREAAAPIVDALQNNRLDALDRAVRDLGLDLSDDRKTLQSIVADLQRQSASQADDTSRFRGGLSERLSSLEDAMHRSRNEPAQLPTAIFERISAIERGIDTRMTELARNQPSAAMFNERLAAIERMLEQRITEVGRGWTAVAERLSAIELASKRPTEAVLPPMLVSRLETVGGLEHKLDGLERLFSTLVDRLSGLERQIGATQAKPVDFAPLHSRLGDLERNVVTRVAQSVDLGPVTELLSGMESRVAGVEQAIESKLGGLERSIENRSAETGRTVSFIGERLRAFEESIGAQKAQQAVYAEQAGARIGQIERSLSAYAERALDAGTAHDRDLTELHDALVKLNANQQTLAGSLEQWRLDNTGDLSVVSNRLKLIEDTTQRRDFMFDAVVSQVSAIHSAVAKREVHKSRFRNWLFGTDEWYAASYDTEQWRARQAVDVLRGLDSRPQPRPVPFTPAPTPPQSGPKAPVQTAMRR